MFDFNALLQFIPQMIIATVVAVYFIYEMDKKSLPKPEFILSRNIRPTVEEKEQIVISEQQNNHVGQKSPFDPKYIEKEENSLFMGIQTASMSLWTGLFLAFTPLTLVKIFIPVKSSFLDSVILVLVAVFFAITFVSLYSIYMKKGMKRVIIGEAASIIAFFAVTYFPSFSWFSSLSLLFKIVVIYFYAVAMLFLIYGLLNVKSLQKKLSIFLYGSICTYGIFAVLLFSELLIKFKV
jgi:cation transport ATPase